MFSENSLAGFVYMIHSNNESSCSVTKQRYLILLLLLISGNVQPNPGPADIDIKICNTPADFKCKSGLGIIHLNVQSLISKLDMVRVWINSTDADVVVLSETWLTKSVHDKDICINGI